MVIPGMRIQVPPREWKRVEVTVKEVAQNPRCLLIRAALTRHERHCVNVAECEFDITFICQNLHLVNCNNKLTCDEGELNYFRVFKRIRRAVLMSRIVN